MKRSLIVFLVLLTYSSPLPTEAVVVYPIQIAAASVAVFPTLTPTATVTPMSTPTVTPTNTPTSTPTSIQLPTSTPYPSMEGIELLYFSPRAVDLITRSFALLGTCSPALHDYVKTNTFELRLGYVTRAHSTGYIEISERLLFSVPADIQPILVMHILAHESRHIEQIRLGLPLDETDANRFFPQLIHDCAQGLNIAPIYGVTNPN